MSKTVDQRVVEMQFDNAHFEKNVSTTMSTIDRLKKSLNFSGVSKGLSDINTAAGKVNMSGLGSAVETVRMKFSALEVMGVTALANITNSAVNAGKRIVSALTIDPIKTGFSEYETQINAVQTILANTSSKGTTIDQVNKALDELNSYADKTIYNFTEMTRNIGTFTAAGIDLETSVNAIQGIANLAAVSGSTSQQASTAMYQLSQALAAGTVKLMDWNSVVNAGMGGEMFQNALKETSELLGTGAEAAIKAEGSFRESLRTGWLTSQVLTETLKKFTTSGANERIAEFTGLSKEAVDAAIKTAEAQYGEAEAIEYASKALAEKSGKNADEIKSILQFAKNAEDAATKVKTFSQLWDVMKEAAQSGWAQTWRLIVGDFEEAKNLLTPIADFFAGDNGIITKISNARNALLEGALGSPFKNLVKEITGVTTSVGEAVDTVKDYSEVVNQIIRGDWGIGQDRWDRLTEAGYDWAHAQNLVNEQLGSTVRYSTAYGEAQKEVAKSQEYTIDQLERMADTQLKSMGYTDEQIYAIRRLSKSAKNAGVPLSEFIKNLDELDGRTLLIKTFKNVGQSIIKVFTSMAKAWREIFPPMTSLQLYNIISSIQQFSEKLVMSDEAAGKLQKTFKGVFAILDVVFTLVGGPLKIAFKILGQLMNAFGVDIFDVTAAIGDAAVKFRDWIDKTLDFTAAFEKIATPIKNAIKSFKDWIEVLKESDDLPRDIANGIINGFGKIVKFIKDVFSNIRQSISDGLSGVPGDLLAGFINGIWNGIKIAGETIKILGLTIIEKLCEALGVESPSWKTYDAATNCVTGFVNGLKDSAQKVWSYIKDFGSKVIELFKKIDFGNLFAAGIVTGIFASVFKIADVAKLFASPLVGLGNMFEDLGDMFEGIGKYFRSKSFKNISDGVLKMAIAIGILAASLILLTNKVDMGNLWECVGALAALAGIVSLMALVVTGLNKLGGGKALGGTLSVLGFSTAILILSVSLKKLTEIGEADLTNALTLLVKLAAGLLSVAIVYKVLGKGSKGLASALVKTSIALLLMVGVVKLASKLDENEIKTGITNLALMELLFVGIIAVSKLSGTNVSKAGTMMLKMSIALLLMVGVVKLAGQLSMAEVKKGLTVMAGVMLLFSAIIMVSKLAGDNAKKAGSMLLMMSLAIGMLVYIMRLISEMDDSQIKRGLVVIGSIELMFAGLIAVSKLAGKNASKIGTMFLGMSAAMLVLVGVMYIISKMDPDGIKRSLGVVSVLMVLFGGLIAVSKLAGDCVKPLIVISVAIAMLVGSVVALSFVKPESLKNATIALSTLMVAFSLIVASTKLSGDIKAGSLLAMTGVIAVLSLIAWGLSKIADTQTLLRNVQSLSILVLAFGSLTSALSFVGKYTKVGDAAKGAASLVVVSSIVAALVSAIGLIFGYLDDTIVETISSGLDRFKMFITQVGLLVMAFVPLTAVLGLMGKFIGVGNAAKGAASLAVVVGIVGALITAIGSLLGLIPQDFASKIQSGLDLFVDMCKKMAIVILAFVPLTAALGVIGSFIDVTAAATGAAALDAVVAIIGAALVAIGGLLGLLPEGAVETIETGLDTMTMIFTKFGETIGGFIGGVWGSFSERAISGITDGLNNFVDGMTNLLDKCEGINPDSVSVLKSLAEAVIILTAADVIDGLTRWFTGGSSLEDFGTQLPGLATNLRSFADNLGSFDESTLASVNGAANVIKTLASAAQEIPNDGGWLGKIFGENNIGDFGSSFAGLGSNLSAFVTNLTANGAWDQNKLDTVKFAAKAVKELALAAQEIPNDGGWIGTIFGENSISTFGYKLPSLGTNLSSFVSNLTANGTWDDSTVSTVKCAADAVKALALAADQIPNDGGWVGTIFGENSISTFGYKLPSLGTNLSSFVSNLTANGTWNKSTVSTVQCAANAVKALALAADQIPNEGGWLDKIFGDNSISTFSSKFGELGTNLSTFATNLGNFDNAKVYTVNCAVRAINALAGLANADLKNANKRLEGFGDTIVNFASDIATFTDKVSDIGNIDTAIDNLEALVSSITDISESNTSVVDSFSKALKEVAEKGIKAFTDAITNSKSKNDVRNASKKLMDKVVDGIEDKTDDVEDAVGEVISSASDSIDSQTNYDTFYNSGSYLMSGLALGMSENSSVVKNAATSAVKAAIEAAEEEAGINSPSKVFYQIGMYVVAGFVNALNDGSMSISNASSNMAETARKSMSKAVSKISEMMSADINYNPTITPVLDLSNVSNGINEINSINGLKPSLGVLSKVSYISSAMNGQNGSNDDVIDAINKLRKDISNINNTSYSIGTITYDDGTNVSNAVKTLVRAAKLERRV